MVLQVDWEGIAAKGGYAHASSARNTWNMLKTRKFGYKPNPRKRKEDEDGEKASPLKKKKAKATAGDAEAKEGVKQEAE